MQPAQRLRGIGFIHDNRMLAERAFYCLGGQPAILAGCPCFARKLFPKEEFHERKTDGIL